GQSLVVPEDPQVRDLGGKSRRHAIVVLRRHPEEHEQARPAGRDLLSAYAHRGAGDSLQEGPHVSARRPPRPTGSDAAAAMVPSRSWVSRSRTYRSAGAGTRTSRASAADPFPSATTIAGMPIAASRSRSGST